MPKLSQAPVMVRRSERPAMSFWVFEARNATGHPVGVNSKN